MYRTLQSVVNLVRNLTAQHGGMWIIDGTARLTFNEAIGDGDLTNSSMSNLLNTPEGRTSTAAIRLKENVMWKKTKNDWCLLSSDQTNNLLSACWVRNHMPWPKLMRSINFILNSWSTRWRSGFRSVYTTNESKSSLNSAIGRLKIRSLVLALLAIM